MADILGMPGVYGTVVPMSANPARRIGFGSVTHTSTTRVRSGLAGAMWGFRGMIPAGAPRGQGSDPTAVSLFPP
jgi:hypothetical protein